MSEAADGPTTAGLRHPAQQVLATLIGIGHASTLAAAASPAG